MNKINRSQRYWYTKGLKEGIKQQKLDIYRCSEDSDTAIDTAIVSYKMYRILQVLKTIKTVSPNYHIRDNKVYLIKGAS